MAGNESPISKGAPLVFSVASQSQERKRNVRTYGKRSASSKTPRHDTSEVGDQSPATPESHQDTPPSHLSTATQEQDLKPNRGSILAYFKPCPPSYGRTPAGSSDSMDTPSTPPESPTRSPRPKKRRRLTTKPGTLEPTPLIDANIDSSNALTLGIELTGANLQEEVCPSRDGGCIVGQPTGHAAQPTVPALREVPVNTLDPTDQITARGPKRRSKTSAKDMTQTTLNLSIHKDTCFTICAVCDILYNPLNEKDRKEHNRRHAAAVRNKRKET
ncbi:hypothetical protein VTJ83DRAFT_3146 [Remersonia thermophila]|uniref:N-acetyltransferase ESCO zinc-finger domain-containing protein n=1 Tax=Remersonia thermophila TaxID=72144 RepID=A0ABR4DDA4_9PEZI